MITGIEEQLARDEGRKLEPYLDTAGWWSIGIGHNLGTKSIDEMPPQFKDGITDAMCDQLFSADLHHTWDLLDAYCGWWTTLPGGTNGPYSGVLVNMGFNLGVPGLASFTQFLALMRARDWDGAANDLEMTKVYKQLPERYGRLRQQIITGQWV